jgi:peptide/nickel transport system substrate-binding protein
MSVNRYLRLLALVGVLAIVGTACGRGGQEAGPGQTPGGGFQEGGTLLAALESDVDAAFDPQKEYYSVTWGFYHCCLLRTLVTTPLAEAAEGGNDLVPDLATDLPEVSEDGLTYTFTLRDGINFAPPYQDQAVTAQSFINALEREADPKVGAGYSFYYSVIEGFDDFADGKADTISGMTAVDDTTLEITLSRPAGEFPFRMAMHAAAPIPDGAAEGHEKDYGRYLAATGPYMFEGSEELDPAGEPVSGYEPGRSIVLVRNPSWDKSTDPHRDAFVDRIEVQIGLTAADGYRKIDTGELDLMLDAVPPPETLQSFQADPERQDQVHSDQADATYYASFNIAEPPFDDIAVRKAVNLAVDKASMLTIRGGPLFGETASHIMIDSLLNNQLADYDPYATPNSEGDIEAAQEAMSESNYDTDGDGVCDAPECNNIVSVTDEADPYPDQARVWQQNLEPLGLNLDISSLERTTMYDKCNDPGAHVAFCLGPGWGKDYSDATTFGEPLFGSAAIGPDSCCNYSLVGAPADVLREHDYTVTEVPGVDDQLAECDALPVGEERFTCFAEIDRTLMEDVVPWVPLTFTKDVFVIADRVQNYVYDQFSGQPALDKIALAGGGEAA